MHFEEPLSTLPFQESMAQHRPDKHDQWWEYMSVLVVNDGIIKSINKLTVVIRWMIQRNVDKL